MQILRQAQDKKRLVLIDGHAILHRAYHAFPKTLTTRNGEIVNAVYGFSRILFSVLKDLHPEYAVVTFDLPVPTFRHKEYVGYQIQRPAMDTELRDQIKRVKEVVQALSIPIFVAEGYEADDVIGTLAKQAAEKGIETIIVTGDKDIMQLVDKQTKVYAPVRGLAEGKLFGPKEVEELLGIKPKQVVDYKALVGDPSDNYPGVPGIGPKTAVKLLKEYGNLNTLYRNFNKLPKLVAQKLVVGKESAELSKKLATIVTGAPVKLDLKACRVSDYDQKEVRRLFEKLEFRSLIDKLPGMASEKKGLPAQTGKKENEQMKLV